MHKQLTPAHTQSECHPCLQAAESWRVAWRCSLTLQHSCFSTNVTSCLTDDRARALFSCPHGFYSDHITEQSGFREQIHLRTVFFYGLSLILIEWQKKRSQWMDGVMKGVWLKILAQGSPWIFLAQKAYCAFLCQCWLKEHFSSTLSS